VKVAGGAEVDGWNAAGLFGTKVAVIECDPRGRITTAGPALPKNAGADPMTVVPSLN
jgi:hypothetical protein